MFLKRKQASNMSSRQPRRDLPTRSAAYSYYEARQPREKTLPRNATAKRSNAVAPSKWRLAIWGLVFMAIIFMVGYNLLLSANPRVVVINASTSSDRILQPLNIYGQKAQEALKQSFSNHTKLTINTTAVAVTLSQEFPELANVSLAIPLIGTQPIVYVQPATPRFVMHNNQNSGDFLIGKSGVVLAAAPVAVVSYHNLPLIINQTSTDIAVGHIVLSQGDVDFIETLLAQLQAEKMTIQFLVLPPSSRELDVHISGLMYLLKFNLGDDSSARQQIGDFLAAKQYLKSKNIVPAQYIDARVPGRAYYH